MFGIKSKENYLVMDMLTINRDKKLEQEIGQLDK